MIVPLSSMLTSVRLMLGATYMALILACLTACGNRNQKIDLPPATPVHADEPDLTLSGVEDTVVYIGFIDKFDDNNTFWTDLYFVNGFNYDEYDQVRKLADSVVFADDEITRKRITLKKGRKYFDLSALTRISIYDKHNALRTTGRLKHIEYVEDVIEDRFVAVYDAENPGLSEYSFCVGNSVERWEGKTFLEIQDTSLDSSAAEVLEISPSQLLFIHHYRSDSVFSALSTDTKAYILEYNEGVWQTLYTSDSDETLYGLVVLPKVVEGKPLVLASCGMPETDATWNSLLVYNGSRYKVANRQRLSR